MDNFHEQSPGNGGDGWIDKDKKEVVRKGGDGYEKFLDEFNSREFTFTEFPGLKPDLSVFVHSNYVIGAGYPAVSLFRISFQDPLYSGKIPAPEHVQMIQQLIQIVQVPSVLIARLQHSRFLIGVIKSRRKPAEQFRHGNVGLGMPVIDRRINEPALSVISGDHVSRPQVSVYQ